MTVIKTSVSLDPDLDREIREAASRSGQSRSAWLAEAAAQRLRSQSLHEFLDDYQREEGTFTDEELSAARERLGYERT